MFSNDIENIVVFFGMFLFCFSLEAFESLNWKLENCTVAVANGHFCTVYRHTVYPQSSLLARDFFLGFLFGDGLKTTPAVAVLT